MCGVDMNKYHYPLDKLNVFRREGIFRFFTRRMKIAILRVVSLGLLLPLLAVNDV